MAGRVGLANLHKGAAGAAADAGEHEAGGVQSRERAPKPAVVYGTLVVVQVIFVMWFYIAKYTMAQVDLPPLIFAMWREVVAAATLVALVGMSLRGGKVGAGKRAEVGETSWKELYAHRRELLLLGVLMFCNVVGFITGLSMVTSFNAAIFQPTQPVFASLVAYAAGFERMSVAKVASVAMACGGAALTVYLGNKSGSAVEGGENGGPEEARLARKSAERVSLGNVVLLVQCLCAGCMWVVQKRVLATIPSAVLVTACSYAIAAVFTVAATVCVFGVGDPRIYVDSAIGWGGILYAALFATVATYVAMAWANRWASPSTVTISLALQPLLSALVEANSVGGDGLGVAQLASCALIIAGLVLKVWDGERAGGGEGPAGKPSNKPTRLQP